jgi:SAM-dependent methyltransferase
MKWINDYKGYIGPKKLYDKIGKLVFELMKKHGLEKTHKVLDVGCGSLRIGQHLINYLNRSNYYGIEPNGWLIDEALKYEDIKKNKNPHFDYNDQFEIPFEKEFDFVIVNSVYIHADKEQIKKSILEISKKLKGKFIFNFIPGKDNSKKGFTYPGAVAYTRKTIEEMIPDNCKFEYIECDYPGKQVFIIVEKKAEDEYFEMKLDEIKQEDINKIK